MIKLMVLREEVILDYPGGSYIITRILIQGTERGRFRIREDVSDTTMSQGTWG